MIFSLCHCERLVIFSPISLWKISHLNPYLTIEYLSSYLLFHNEKSVTSHFPMIGLSSYLWFYCVGSVILFHISLCKVCHLMSFSTIKGLLGHPLFNYEKPVILFPISVWKLCLLILCRDCHLTLISMCRVCQPVSYFSVKGLSSYPLFWCWGLSLPLLLTFLCTHELLIYDLYHWREERKKDMQNKQSSHLCLYIRNNYLSHHGCQ